MIKLAPRKITNPHIIANHDILFPIGILNLALDITNTLVSQLLTSKGGNIKFCWQHYPPIYQNVALWSPRPIYFILNRNGQHVQLRIILSILYNLYSKTRLVRTTRTDIAKSRIFIVLWSPGKIFNKSLSNVTT